MCAWSSPMAGDTPADYSEYKLTEYRHADKVHIPSDGKMIQTVAESSILVEGDSVKVSRPAYRMIAKGYNHLHPIKEVMVQNFLFCKVFLEDKETEYRPIELPNNVVLEETNNKYDYSPTVPGTAYNVTYDQIIATIKTDIDMAKQGGCVEIRFKFGVYTQMFRDKGDPMEYKIRMVASESKPVKLYLCKPGKIAFAEGTPVLEEGAMGKIMALYPRKIDSPVAFSLVSAGAPSKFPDDNQKLVWAVTKGGEEVKSKTTGSSRASIENGTFVESGMSFDYAELSPSGVLTEGDVYSVTRTIKTGSETVACTSEPVECKVIKDARLAGFAKRELKVCPGIGELGFNSRESYLNQTKWLHIKGNRLNVDSVSYSGLYDARYAWEYIGEDGRWLELPLNEGGLTLESQYNSPDRFSALYNNAPQDLVVPLQLLKAGHEYRFRQVAYLGGFGDKRIVADTTGVLRVGVYDTITRAMLDVTPLHDICLDNTTHNDTVRISLKEGTDVRSLSAAAPNVMKYSYSFPGGNAGGEVTSNSLEFGYGVFANVSRLAFASYTVEDGCGARVVVKDSMMVNDIPVLELGHIMCSNASTSVEGGVFKAEVAGGGSCVLSVSKEDADFSASDYLYSDDGQNYQKIGSRGLEVALRDSSHRRVYLMKRSRTGTMCESEPAVVELFKAS